MFEPGTLMKLSGMPMHRIFSEMLGESFAKCFARAAQYGRFSQKLIQRLLVFLQRAVAESGFMRDLVNAIQNPEKASEEMRSLGSWECLFRGYLASTESHQLQPNHAFRIEIEQASFEPIRLLRENKITESLDYLLANPLMRQFFWPEAIQCYAALKTNKELPPLQLSISLEVELSILASLDVHYAPEGISWFSELLPSESRNPTAQLFRWLTNSVEAESIGGLLDESPLNELTNMGRLDAGTVKQWSCGDHHPQQQTINEMAVILFPEQNGLPLCVRDWAVRNLNLWGYLVQTVRERVESAASAQQKKSVQPWPNLPFGYASFEEWCQARYPVWLEFHRKKKNAGTEHPHSI